MTKAKYVDNKFTVPNKEQLWTFVPNRVLRFEQTVQGVASLNFQKAAFSACCCLSVGIESVLWQATVIPAAFTPVPDLCLVYGWCSKITHVLYSYT